MSKPCAYVLRVCILVLTAAALALAVVACFIPLFGTGPSGGVAASSNSTQAASGVNSLTNVDSNGHLTVFDSQQIDLFNYKATVTSPSSSTTTAAGVTKTEEKWALRTRYFTCQNGRTLIQAAEGTAVIGCVLACANLVLAIFLFFFQPVVRVPLCVYAFLAAAAEAAALGLVLHLYMNGWCPEMAIMQASGLWELKIGVILMIVSCDCSVITCILALIVSCCR